MGKVMNEMLLIDEEGEQFYEGGEQFMIYFKEFGGKGLVLVLKRAVSDYFEGALSQFLVVGVEKGDKSYT